MESNAGCLEDIPHISQHLMEGYFAFQYSVKWDGEKVCMPADRMSWIMSRGCLCTRFEEIYLPNTGGPPHDASTSGSLRAENLNAQGASMHRT